MTIDKKTKVDKAIKVANFVKDIEGKLKRIPNYSGIHGVSYTHLTLPTIYSV